MRNPSFIEMEQKTNEYVKYIREFFTAHDTKDFTIFDGPKGIYLNIDKKEPKISLTFYLTGDTNVPNYSST